MSTGLQKMKQQFDQLSSRERNILMVATIAVVVFFWDQLLFAPLQRASTNLEQQINATHTKISDQSAQMVEVMKAANEDPNRELKQRKPQLEQAIQTADQKIDQLTSKLIPPRKMAKVLEQVLRQETKLSLVKVTNIPGRQIGGDLKSSKNGEANSSDVENSVLYQHGVELQLEGEYFQTLRYLKALEQMPWQVLWSELEYEVQEYPRASIRLIINTLSTDSGWIGV